MAGNSWQQPVAGEPSWGSPHTHVETLVSAVDPAGTGDTLVTVTNAPAGAMGIWGWAAVGSAATAGRILSIKDAAGANTFASIPVISTAIAGRGTFTVPLNASKQFAYSVSNADVNAVTINMGGYFI